MNEKNLHIIAFDIPYPANYGGVIDVFYGIKALHQLGVKIHLHCFEYGRDRQDEELLKYCEKVWYYKRQTSIFFHLSISPYIIRSRQSKALENRLLQDNYPILCEGLHTAHILTLKKFEGRQIFVRPTNIEHDYYNGLARNENIMWKRSFFKMEARKLKRWEQNISKASAIFPVSKADYNYFKEKYKVPVQYIPVFHAHQKVKSKTGKGKYILYHGNLSVAENHQTALSIIQEIAPLCNTKIIIAGKNPSKDLRLAARDNSMIDIQSNLSNKEMDSLMQEAHIHVLLTNQATGFKLKLINALFTARYIVANDKMMNGEDFENKIFKANSTKEIASTIEKLMKKDFSSTQLESRKKFLDNKYQTQNGALSMKNTIFKAPII